MCVKPQVLVGGEDGARLPPHPPKPLPCDGSGLGAMLEPEQKPGSCERGAESQERRTSGPRLVHQPGPQPARPPACRGPGAAACLRPPQQPAEVNTGKVCPDPRPHHHISAQVRGTPPPRPDTSSRLDADTRGAVLSPLSGKSLLFYTDDF